MKFVIGENEYPARPLDQMTGGLIAELKRETGMGLRGLTLRLEEWERLGFDDDGNAVVLPEDDPRIDPFQATFDSEPHWTAVMAWLWVSRRIAGERVSFAEACDFVITDFHMAADADDVEEAEPEADPTSPPASDPQEPGDADTTDGSATSSPEA